MDKIPRSKKNRPMGGLNIWSRGLDSNQQPPGYEDLSGTIQALPPSGAKIAFAQGACFAVPSAKIATALAGVLFFYAHWALPPPARASD